MSDHPDNIDRARWAHAALVMFASNTGQLQCFPEADSHEMLSPDAFEEVAGDLICNLMHYADMIGVDPESVIDSGRGHHDAEQSEWPEV